MRERLLHGKVALVTGAAQGIGLAVARAFAAHGAKVVLADINEAATVEAARFVGDLAFAVPLDVRDEAQQIAAIDAAISRFGRIDCVVANAGLLLLKHAVDMEASEWQRVLDVNLTGAFLTAKAASRRFIDQGEGGRIILTSSVFGVRGGAENAAYSASKFGMIGLAQCLAAELAPYDVLVNCVCPGQMDTAMLRQVHADRAMLQGIDPGEVRQALEARIPAGRVGTADELAGTYIYLASKLSGYVTGQAIIVDGGWQVG